MAGAALLKSKFTLGAVRAPSSVLKVGVVAGEAAETGHQAVGKKGNVGVVVLHGFVVAAAFDGDTIFRSGQFVLQPQESFRWT